MVKRLPNTDVSLEFELKRNIGSNLLDFIELILDYTTDEKDKHFHRATFDTVAVDAYLMSERDVKNNQPTRQDERWEDAKALLAVRVRKYMDEKYGMPLSEQEEHEIGNKRVSHYQFADGYIKAPKGIKYIAGNIKDILDSIEVGN